MKNKSLAANDLVLFPNEQAVLSQHCCFPSTAPTTVVISPFNSSCKFK